MIRQRPSFMWNIPFILVLDSIFFLHHAQLDHLWWRWQEENRQERLHTYFGKHMFNSTASATVDDLLLYGGLVPHISVSEVMVTEVHVMCYRYC